MCGSVCLLPCSSRQSGRQGMSGGGTLFLVYSLGVYYTLHAFDEASQFDLHSAKAAAAAAGGQLQVSHVANGVD